MLHYGLKGLYSRIRGFLTSGFRYLYRGSSVHVVSCVAKNHSRVSSAFYLQTLCAGHVRIERCVVTGLALALLDRVVISVVHVDFRLIGLLLNSIGTGLAFHLDGYSPRLSPYTRFRIQKGGMLRLFTYMPL